MFVSCNSLPHFLLNTYKLCEIADTTDVVSFETVTPTASNAVLPTNTTASVEIAGELTLCMYTVQVA